MRSAGKQDVATEAAAVAGGETVDRRYGGEAGAVASETVAEEAAVEEEEVAGATPKSLT